ncbi:hypothetical protein RRL34_004263 [Vibrio parahaemolyticus]|nr:hypothetical protein [Vibrio parahaemolyticus]
MAFLDKLLKRKKKVVETKKESVIEIDIFSTSFEQFCDIVGYENAFILADDLTKELGFNPNHLREYIRLINRGHAVGLTTILQRVAEYMHTDSRYVLDTKRYSVMRIKNAINSFAHDLAYSFDHKDIQRATWMQSHSDEEIKSGFYAKALIDWRDYNTYRETH